MRTCGNEQGIFSPNILVINDCFKYVNNTFGTSSVLYLTFKMNDDNLEGIPVLIDCVVVDTLHGREQNVQHVHWSTVVYR